jgi:peptidoglycan hydrolase-like protein with peptidoglycan-binding domain
MRTALVVFVLAATGLLALDLRPSAGPPDAAAAPPRKLAQAPERPATVRVAFFRDGRLVRVQRVVPAGMSSDRFALRELFEGPTREERRSGIGTAIPKAARVRSLRGDDEIWRLNVSRSTFAVGTAETKRRRLWQLEATLAPLGDQGSVLVATEGRFVTVQRLGLQPGPWTAETGEKDYLYSVRGAQLRLLQLGYLARPSVTGTVDYLTEQALLAFQGWERLERTGTFTGETQRALFTAETPKPAYRFHGRHVEIFRDLGVLLLVDDGNVVRAIHTSTGSFGRTPAGDFHVYAKSLYSWSVPFKVWMPYASYFHGGIAMHQYPDVPSYPASHGCVRLPAGEAQRVYDFVDVGTSVFVR